MTAKYFLVLLLCCCSVYTDKIEGLTNIEISTEKPAQEEARKQSDTKTESVRHKRQWFYEYGPPDYPPPYLPHRPSAPDYELNEILKRVQEITSLIRQSATPPVPPTIRIPIYVPVYRRPICNCPNNNKPTPTDSNNNTPRPKPTPTEPPKTNPNNVSTPILEDRFNGDEIRPVSFDPIPPPRPISRPPPPVEHGSSQAGQSNDNNFSDTVRPVSFDPIPPSRPTSRPSPPVEHGSSQASVDQDNNGRNELNQFIPVVPISTTKPPQSSYPVSNQNKNVVDNDSIYFPSSDDSSNPGQYDSNKIYVNSPFTTSRPTKGQSGNVGTQNQVGQGTTHKPTPIQVPTSCDSAILSCCHRQQVTLTCLQSHGCRNSEVYRNPCEPNRVLLIVEKFQRYYQNG